MAQSTRRWYEWPDHWRSFRNVPLKRLWILYLAVFFLFCVVGFFSDLMSMGQIPYATAIMIAVATGVDAMLWLFMMNKLPWPTVFILVALQFAMGPILGSVARWMGATFALRTPAQTSGIHFAAFATLAVAILSYTSFVIFLQATGRDMLKIRNELELAHGIQKTLVPPVVLNTELYEVYGISEPSDKVGGDLVDAVLLPNGDVVAYLADIAGHGLPAGILMGMLKTAARTALLDAAAGHPSATLPLLLEKLNRVLPDVKEPQMYATLTAFRLNADGSAWYATAASPPVLHWSGPGRDARLVEEKQFPLGLLPVSGFTGEAIEVQPGDLLVVATDGVLEVADRKGEEFGIERVEKAIAGDARAPLQQLAGTILERARTFGKQADDQTLLLIRRL
ncbi:MAG TPA: PP2C family protein-serine/threonine phosphatase [Acidobacteriaceae bacterium]|nr:PP2C family protein-serine/threonine phosphatase [Acidobacteriaceae bacterium]